MTAAQMKAMRDLHETTTRTEQTMTAREMALTAHNLDRTGDKATTIGTGEVWYWDVRRDVWAR